MYVCVCVVFVFDVKPHLLAEKEKREGDRGAGPSLCLSRWHSASCRQVSEGALRLTGVCVGIMNESGNVDVKKIIQKMLLRKVQSSDILLAFS